jgi:hypothetical protein
VLSSQLTLSHQLNESELVDPDDTLAERIKSRDLNNLTMFATKLSSGNDLLTLFPRPPLKNHLYILVRHLLTGESEFPMLSINRC